MEVVTLVLTSASCDRKLLGNGLCPPRSEKEEEDLQVLEQTFSLSPWWDHVGAGIHTAALWWVDHVQLSDAHLATLSFPLLNRIRDENTMERLVGQDKGRVIAYQLPLQAKQIQLGEKLI